MLEKEGKNIDACTIGIPDHMHATVALACMQAGKHVYVEKPLTRTPWEARLMADAAKKYGVATQMGNQGYSHEGIRVAGEILWSGEIGDVREAHVAPAGDASGGADVAAREKAVPSNLDWDLWLGGASMRPYNNTYTPYNWRGISISARASSAIGSTHTAGPGTVRLAARRARFLVERVSEAGPSKSYTFPTRALIRLVLPARGGTPPSRSSY